MSFHLGMGTRPHSIAPARVSLVLPALIWPGGGISASLRQLDLSALASFCGQGKTAFSEPLPWSQWLPQQFGTHTLDWARLRWAGETPARPAQQHVLCADPVSLNFASDALLLRGPDELALQAEECSALIAALNKEFGDLGEWFAASPARWYLLPAKAVQTQFHPLSEVLGRPVAFFPPEGPQAREWNRIANEIQVMLHNHPVNQARNHQGHLMANALWFWGQNAAESSATPLQAPCSHLCSSDPLLRGLARQAGCSVHDTSAQLLAGHPGHSWWVNTALQEALLAGNFTAWLGELARLERECLQPLLAAWQAGRIKEIQLISPCDKTLFSTTLSARSRWCFWRKALSPDALAALLQTDRSPKAPAP